MPNYAMLSAIGKDRPGIAAGVSRILFEKDCNIEDSRMARLGGDFAIMLMVRMPEGTTVRQMEQDLAPLSDELELTFQLTDLRPEDAMEAGETPKHVVSVYGADKKGIVAKITRHLADRSVNITDLTTHVVQHAQPLYIMLIEVEIPPYVDPDALRQELVKAGKEIDVEVSMRLKEDDTTA
ncbi:MAG: amino acid-binding protein [Phycisphaerae bacterium]|nr:amino acid-binding protein [Phycisphaerae bacterium]